ncbi:hypothetical protein [Almyronema epifaneia]|uniref:Uncharacterized protein n=1 Tax=Almyronema epifaneia S1 TaxID=2991925 RepID=A0ABW6IBW6_9CYAN
MITVKSMKQIATSRTIASMRSLRHLGSNHSSVQDQGRRMVGYSQMVASETYRQWQQRQWQRSK